jgi:hypothetical protein
VQEPIVEAFVLHLRRFISRRWMNMTRTILLTPNERRVAEDRRDCYWLYIVTNGFTEPKLQDPIKDPARFPWHQATKVAHCRLEVYAMTWPMMVSEDDGPYGGEKS